MIDEKAERMGWRSRALAMAALLTAGLAACSSGDPVDTRAPGAGEAGLVDELSGTTWIVDAIAGTPVTDTRLAFAENPAEGLLVSISDPCSNDVAQLDLAYPTFVVAVAPSREADCRGFLTGLFPAGRVIEIAVNEDQLRMRSGDTQVDATHFRSTSVHADASAAQLTTTTGPTAPQTTAPRPTLAETNAAGRPARSSTSLLMPDDPPGPVTTIDLASIRHEVEEARINPNNPDHSAIEALCHSVIEPIRLYRVWIFDNTQDPDVQSLVDALAEQLAIGIDRIDAVYDELPEEVLPFTDQLREGHARSLEALTLGVPGYDEVTAAFDPLLDIDEDVWLQYDTVAREQGCSRTI